MPNRMMVNKQRIVSNVAAYERWIGRVSPLELVDLDYGFSPFGGTLPDRRS